MKSASFPDLSAPREALLAGRTLRLRRFCLCCGETTPMLVDLRASYQGPDGERVPNWREGLVCPGCGLNNRQRLMATLVKQEAAQRASLSIYLMEQVTPIYEWVRRLPHTDVRASEYLGPGISGVRMCEASGTRTSWPCPGRMARSS